MKGYMQKVWGRGMALFGSQERKKRLVDWNDLFVTPVDLDGGDWYQIVPELVEDTIAAWPGSTCFARIIEHRRLADLRIGMTEQIAIGEDAARYLRQVATTMDTLLTEVADIERAPGETARRISLPTLGDETVAWVTGHVTTMDGGSAIGLARGAIPPEDKVALAHLDKLQGEVKKAGFTVTSYQHEATAWVRIRDRVVIIVSVTVNSSLQAMEEQQEVALTTLKQVTAAAWLKALKGMS